MQSNSLYRKFRPFQLDDVVGQVYTIQTLKEASKSDKFSHAYMFSGNFGCGKTSTARIVANLMNCTDVKDGVLCGKCRACKTIPKEASMDVVELAAATHTGVEHVRALIDSSQWSPVELKYKVFIIDECQGLSKAANEALLKILEEPPSYIKLILTTTEPEKLVPTILSRCQRYKFNRIPTKLIAKRLKFIADAENIKSSDGALFALAKLSRGSMRDGIKYLEQIGIIAAGKTIKEDHVHKLFGTIDRMAIMNIIKAIIARDIPLLVDYINDFSMAAADTSQIMLEVTEVLRNIQILVASEKRGAKLVDLPESEIEELIKISKSVSLDQLIGMSSLFSDIKRDMAVNINSQWIMEATLINCCKSLEK